MTRLAWLLALTSIATSVVHMGVVRHERCLEHGELIEVRGAPADQEPGAATMVVAASASERHDEHCPLANVAAAPAEHAPLLLVHDGLVAQVRVALELEDEAHESVDALDVAPKQGPPDLAV